MQDGSTQGVNEGTHVDDSGAAPLHPGDPGHPPAGATAQRAPRSSTRRFVVFVIVAVLLAGAVVAHLLTGPGLSH